MEQQKPSNPQKPKQYNVFLKYTGLGLQLCVTIGVAGWLGYMLDQKLGFKFPAFLLSFIIIALVGSLYMLIKNLPKE